MGMSIWAYLILGLIALIVLQLAVQAFMMFLPTLLFIVGLFVALVCAYAVISEKKRIPIIDRLLGIASEDTASTGNAAYTEVAASVAAQPSASPPPAMDGTHPKPDIPTVPAAPVIPSTGSGESPTTPPLSPPPQANTDSKTGNAPDDLSAGRDPSSPIIPPVSPPVVPHQILPVVPPAAPPISPGRVTNPASTPAGGQSKPKIDYAGLIKGIASQPKQIVSKEELTTRIKQSMIGQEVAIESLVKVVRMKLAIEGESNKPLVVLLPGPTGTGKTELSKALAKALSTELVRFDMGEYADSFKVSNLFGSPKGYVGSTDGGALPNAIRKNTKGCMVVLFDEVEKAHKDIWQQMLALIDEGRTGDSLGNVVVPKDTIFLMTTNRKAEEIAAEPGRARDLLQLDQYFSPEFLGRIDKIIPLPRLDEASMAQLTHRTAEALARKYSMELLIDEPALVALYLACKDRASKSGGRGIFERVGELLGENLIEIRGNGHRRARVVVTGGTIHAVPE